MASIKKIDKDTWKVTVYVGRGPKGEVLREYATARTEAEAKKIARELEDEVEKGKLTNVSKMKMADWMDKWLEINKPLLSSTTIKAYSLYIETHFKMAFKGMRVSDITDLHVKAYIADKLLELSSTTVRKHFYTLQKILKDALKHNSPCIGIKAPKNSEFKPTIPTEEEFNQIRQAFAEIGPEHEAVILLAGWNGMRRGEIFALKDDDIDAQNGYVRVDEALALAEDDYRYEVKDPKSSNSKRDIATPDYLIDLLQRIAKANKAKKESTSKVVELKQKKKGKEAAHPIFTITPGSWTNLYAKTIREKQLPKVRFHDLRHYHASWLYKHSVPDLYASQRLGHDIWVLKRIYQHLGLETQKELDNKIKDLFK